MPMRLPYVVNRPTHEAKNFPVANFRRVDPAAARGDIGVDKVLARAKAADRTLVIAEAPRSRAQPAQVLSRAADMAAFPVQHGAQSIAPHHQVAGPEVAVQKSPARRAHAIAFEPAQTEFDRRMS